MKKRKGNSETDMTVGRPLPLILKFMIPLFIGNVFQQIYNMADTIIVGRFVGEKALAAVGSTGTIMFLVLGFSQGLTTGFTVLTSQCYGARDMDRLKHSVANGILLSAFVSLVVTLLSTWSMRGILHVMNTPADIYQDAWTYITIICAGSAVSIYYNLLSSYLRAVGNSEVPLLFLVFSACLNVVLDLVLIINAHMGVAGAAVATVISQGVSAVLCAVYIFVKIPMLRPKAKDWYLSAQDTRHQLIVGLPMALQFAITASGTMIMQSALNLFGSVAVAAFTAASKLQNLVMQGMISMGQAMATFCGQNYGKGDDERIRKGTRQAVLALVVYSFVAGTLMLIGVETLMGFFFTRGTNLSAMLPYARTYARHCVMFYIPLSLIFVYRNAMQGCGFGLLPMLGGGMELVSRLFMAVLSMHMNSYSAACFCDPFAWLTTGIYSVIAWLFVSKKVRERLGGKTS